MAILIDEQKWQWAFCKPNWYEFVLGDFKKLEELASKEQDYDKRKAIKAEAYDLVEQALKNNQIYLAKNGKDFDKERQSIYTIVIHHTANKPGMTLDRLNTIQLLRLYARYYNQPPKKDKKLQGQAVWSGHFFESKQVFWAYHWLIRQDGKAEQLLKDEYIGWHSGDWSMNARSIAICIDDYLQDKKPSKKVLDAIAQIIKTNYPSVKNIIGHREVNPNTECPGNLFLSDWKKKLIQLII